MEFILCWIEYFWDISSINIMENMRRKNINIKKQIAFTNLDFADLFKPVIVDRVIFSLVNLLQLQSEVHFEEKESGAIYLNKEGKRIFIKAFEEKLADKIKLGEKTYTYKQIIEEEIRKFKRYIVKEYKPYKYW